MPEVLRGQPIIRVIILSHPNKLLLNVVPVMAIGVVEFSRVGYKIRKVFAQESTYPKEIFEC